MASDVTMPRLSDSMEEGTVLKWLVDEGAEVKRGEPLVEIETDKANMTYDADADGTLIEIVAQEGDTLAIGELIARIGEAGEAGSNGKPEAEEKTEEEEPEAEEEQDEEDAGAEDEAAKEEDEEAVTADAGETRGGGGGGDGGGETQPGGDGGGTATRERAPSGDGNGGERVKASPVARRMARELGLELRGIDGTGPGGRIVKADVQAAAEDGGARTEEAPAEAEAEPAEAKPERGAAEPARAEAGPKGEAEIQELTRLQQTVSRRMAESKATAPDFSISLDGRHDPGGRAAQPAEGGRRPGAVLQRHGREGGRARR